MASMGTDYAMQVADWGGPETLTEHAIEAPVAGPDEVVIDVAATACNFFDALIIAGQYQERPERPFAPGAEVAGTVRAVGADVSHIAVGQKVMAMLPFGGYSSVVKAAAGDVFLVPEKLTMEQAAAFGIVYQTSYFGLVFRANLQPGETVLIHAAAGGVGLAAVQIAKAMGARVFGTAGGPDKCRLAEEHGAEVCFDYRSVDWRKALKEATEGRGADVIYDPVGGDIFDQSVRALAFGGRLLVVGFASGRIPTVAANYVLLKNISIVGLHWGAYRKHDPDKIGVAMCKLFGMVDRDEVMPLVSQTMPLREAAKAIGAVTGRKTVGKVVLIP